MTDQQAYKELLDAQQRRMQVLAYEFHDGLCPKLTAALCHLEALRELHRDGPELGSDTLDRAIRLLSSGLTEVRTLIRELQSSTSEGIGILSVTEKLRQENALCNGPDIRIDHNLRDEVFSPELERAAFRIMQEALTNARCHSESDQVTLTLTRANHTLCIQVQDRGRGFEPAEVDDACLGLKGIHARARLLGGHAVLRSSPGRGTCLTVELPTLIRNVPYPH